MIFDQWLETADFSGVDVIVMIGLGPNGDRAKRLRERTVASIHVYEPREKIREKYALVERCLVSSTPLRLRARTRAAAQEAFGDIVLIKDDSEVSAIERDAGVDAVRDVEEAWEEAKLAAWYKFHGAVYTADRRVRSTMEGLDLLFRHPPVNLLEGKLSGRAGVVVGAGPSLDRNIAVLAEHRERFLVAAVNTSLPALEAAGIEPDVVVVCEAKPVGASIAGIPSIRKAILIPGIHASRDTWELPWRRIAPAFSDEGIFGLWVRQLFDFHPVPIGGSSCCLAAGALYLLGCDPIVLVGNDCAPSGGQLYSSHAAFAGTTVDIADDAATITKSDAKLAVEDVGRKERTVTSPTIETWSWDRSERITNILIYDGLRQWFEEMAEQWSDRRLINATEGGAHILGWEHIALSDAVKGLEPLGDQRDDLDELLSGCDAPMREKALEGLAEQIDGARRMVEVTRRGVQIMSRCEEIQKEMSSAGADPMSGWSWDLVEQRRHDGSDRLFDALATQFDAMDGAAELAELMREARELQRDPIMTSPSAMLLDAYSWGFLEQSRRRRDLGVFGIFKGMMSELERGATELIPLLEETMERVNER